MQIKIAALLLSGLCLISLVPHVQAQFITQPRPTTPDYLCHTTRTRQSILLERWAPHEFPINVYLPTPYGISDIPLVQRQAVVKALTDWNKAWPGFTYSYVDHPVKNGIEFIWHETVPFKLSSDKEFLPFYRDAINRVVHTSKIHLPTRFGYTKHGNSKKADLSVQETSTFAMHKIGHALGLYHSDSNDDIMKIGLHHNGSRYHHYMITRRDIQTLQRLYLLPYNIEHHPCPKK